MGVPAITVAMSVYNGERFLASAIESVLAQTFTDFEFLILDDGSSDGSRSIVEGFARKDSRIRPIVRENRGLIASLNQLLNESRAPLVARMDADDICQPTRFSRQIAFLADNPDHGVVGTWCEDIDEAGGPWVGSATAPQQFVSHEDFLRAVETGSPLLCHPSVVFLRDLVLGVGGYHAAFKHCEDLDLWLRLAAVTRLANIPEPLIRYRHYADQVSSRHATEQQTGAAVAKLAYYERQAGRKDPTAALDRLPPIDDLNTLFGRHGVAQEVRAQVAPGLLYSRAGLSDNGFDLVLRYLRDGGDHKGMWRTVARLVTFGDPVRALRLAQALAAN